MAYREAKTEAEKKRGKSTDELSFKEALAFFKKRGKEKGLSKLRWRGDAYNVNGEKVGGKKRSPAKPESSSSSSAPASSKRPMRRTGKLNDDAKAGRTNSNEQYGTGSGPRTAAPKPSSSENASTTPRASASDEDSFPSRANSAREETQRLLKETAPIDRGISYEEWEAMTRAERRAAGLPLTKVGWQNQRLTYRSSADTTERNSSTARSDDARARATRTDRSRNSPDIPGMAKGGMVKKGTRDYKKSGMFYKSGSPRGYK